MFRFNTHPYNDSLLTFFLSLLPVASCGVLLAD